ncbi:MAG TPA: hypothetical protein VEC99_11410, partial [Clostridia bacterium]|nr:hypothetical protein [Clostridia bacterium]
MKVRALLCACILLIPTGVLLFRYSRLDSEWGRLSDRLHQRANLLASAVPKSESLGTNASSRKHSLSREFDPVVNPYASALREPGKSKRPWDPNFLKLYEQISTGVPIRFGLTEGRVAVGTVHIAQHRGGELTYVSGDLIEPEAGKFFVLKPPTGGRAGKAAGVIEFWGSKTAYRIEPTGPDGDPELWQRRLDEVLCLSLPLMIPGNQNEIETSPNLRPDATPDYAPTYNSNIVSLQSCPGAPAVLLLDFFGGYTPTWGGIHYAKPTLSNYEIRNVWKRVVEDFMPFNLNVTTDIRVYESAPISSRQKCIFTPSTSAMPVGAAGVAYIGSWNWGNDTVCWSIYLTGKAAGEVAAHESGHALGLGHQGTLSASYYGGHGVGATGWAPIMGVGYYHPVTTWAQGEYQDADNDEDELNIIVTQNNNVTYRADDAGSFLASSRYLEVYPDYFAHAEGIIERTGDSDAFRFSTQGGWVSLNASPVGDWGNLALSVSLLNAQDTVLVGNHPQNVLSAGIQTNLSAGTYSFRVTGAGRNDPFNSGFSAYGSLGYYSVT